MFYELKLELLKRRGFQKIRGKFQGLRKRLGMRSEFESGDVRPFLIRRYVPDRSFVDIGCMWGVNGYWSFFAEECGAKSVAAVDIYPASEEFKSQEKRRASTVEFIQGDINSMETIDKIGPRDVVFCSGLLYHMPDPIYTLSKLRVITRGILILNTMTIPELPGIQNAAVFYPFLDERQRKMWRQGTGLQYGITEPYRPEQGYGNWFWGFSPSCVESMLLCTGFEVVESHPQDFSCCFVARIAPDVLLQVSGDWTESETMGL